MLRGRRDGAVESQLPGQAEAALASRNRAAGQYLAWAGRGGAGEPGWRCMAVSSHLAVS